MDEETITNYLETQKKAEQLRMDIESEIRKWELYAVISKIIQEIEKGNNTIWYAGPSTIKINQELILEVCITSYNMGVRKYLKEIKKEIQQWITENNINYIKGVDVYWKDTLPGVGNLGIRRE